MCTRNQPPDLSVGQHTGAVMKNVKYALLAALLGGVAEPAASYTLDDFSSQVWLETGLPASVYDTENTTRSVQSQTVNAFRDGERRAFVDWGKIDLQTSGGNISSARWSDFLQPTPDITGTLSLNWGVDYSLLNNVGDPAANSIALANYGFALAAYHADGTFSQDVYTATVSRATGSEVPINFASNDEIQLAIVSSGTLTVSIRPGDLVRFVGYGLCSSSLNSDGSAASCSLSAFADGRPLGDPPIQAGSGTDYSQSFRSAAPVPEPGEWAMMVLGLGIVGGMARRRAAVSA